MTRNASPRLQDTPARIDPTKPAFFDAHGETLEATAELRADDYLFETQQPDFDGGNDDDQ